METSKVEFDVIFPSGREAKVPMSPTLSTTDHSFQATVEVSEVGNYLGNIVFEGIDPNGNPFTRVATHFFPVVFPSLAISGLGKAEYKEEEEMVYFEIDVDVLDTSLHKTQDMFLAYAEVYGTDASGLHYVPVGWVEAMVDVEQKSASESTVTLQMHQNWFSLAGASAPYQLRNVRLSDRNHNVPITTRDSVFIVSENSFTPQPLNHLVVSDLMKYGPHPAYLKSLQTEQEGTLVLVHGYCAGSNPWPVNEFDNAVKFYDLDQGRSHDEFATLLWQFVSQFPTTSLIGHSQGGAASVHLKAFYWSSLDNSANGRPLQSLGTPYQGTTLAGNLAAIGELLGIGCGAVSDMTFDGAALWLASMPPGIQEDGYYYTTSHPSCIFGINLFLSSPNDGTCENNFANLPHGNFQGDTPDWCHTTGMKAPPQATDKQRNAEMNKLAAR